MKSIVLTLICFFPFWVSSQTKDSLKVQKNDSLSSKIFSLGEVTITTTRENNITRLTRADIGGQNKLEVSKALNMLSGITLTSFGQRNESTISIRGFDLRAVPVYMDGIPVYVPYDGYVDLARFTTFDLSAIDVSKGFSSMLFGPNSMGGTINLISRKPISKLEYDGAIGLINTNGYNGNINLGTNLGKLYAQGGFSYLHRDSYTLSKKYLAHAHESGGERKNSYRTDQKVNFKLGWTPTIKQEYVVGYINQHGSKGTPLYAGDDKLNTLSKSPRYWQWPAWDKETYYFLSNNKIHENHYLKSRIYYDIFKNTINSYDDSTYSTQKKPYAFQSNYNDYTYGLNLEYGTTIIPNNELKISAQFKEDVHRENNIGEPIRRFEDNTLYFAIEDKARITKNLVLIPGISYNERTNIQAQDYNSKKDLIMDYSKANPSKVKNGQLGMFYSFNQNHGIGLTTSVKSRFATIKDRYSYRMGTAIPNPNLKPELAQNLDLSYSGIFIKNLNLSTSLFYNHISDAILNVSNVQPGKSQMQNTGAAEFKGIELSLGYAICKNLLIRSNYTYTEMHNLTNPSVLFTGVPYTKIYTYISYKPVPILDLMASTEYNSVRYSTSYGTKAPEFTLINGLVTFNVWNYLSLVAGVNNIFDQNYMLTEGYPEEGRNYFITLRFYNHN